MLHGRLQEDMPVRGSCQAVPVYKKEVTSEWQDGTMK